MGIQYTEDKEGRGAPVLVCDHCKERIRNGESVVKLWKNGSMEFVHKTHEKAGCDDHTDGDSGWYELKQWFVYLAANCGLKSADFETVDDAKAHVGIHEE